MPQPSRLIASGTRLGVGIACLLMAIAAVFLLKKTAPQLEQADRAATARELTVFSAIKPNVNRQWSGYGLAEAQYSANVPARLTATVTEKDTTVLPGAYVNKDSVLAQLDAEDFEQQVEILRQVIENLNQQQHLLDTEEENLKEALLLADESVAIGENELARVQKLVDQKAGRQKDLDDTRLSLVQTKQTRLDLKKQIDGIPSRRLSLKAQISEQQSNLKLAQLSRGRVTITTPIEGILQMFDLELGENIRAGETVARVVDLETLEIPVRLPAAARASVKVGDKVLLQPSNGSSDQVEAKVERISPGDSTDSRTITVYAVLKQPGANKKYAQGDTTDILVPGQFLSATVVEETQVCSFVIPRRSIRAGRVMVVRDGILDSVPVKSDFAYQGILDDSGLPDEQWMVLTDRGDDELLREGDQIVLNASTSAAVGDDIRPKSLSTSPALSTPVTSGGGAEQ